MPRDPVKYPFQRGKMREQVRADQERFLEAFELTGSWNRACHAIGQALGTVENWAKRDVLFSEAIYARREQYALKHLKHVDELCLDGVERSVIDKEGKVVSTRREYPYDLIKFRTQMLFPDETAGRLKVDGTHRVLVVPATASEEEWEKAYATAVVSAPPALPEKK